MKIGNVIIEIDGINHKLIRSKAERACGTCSIKRYCNGNDTSPVFIKMCSTLKGDNGKFIVQK